MKCFYPLCPPGRSLFRLNAKGQAGVWACREHMKNTDGRIDPEVNEIVSLLEKRTDTSSTEST